MKQRNLFAGFMVLFISSSLSVFAQREENFTPAQNGNNRTARSKKDWLALHPQDSRTLQVDILGITNQSFSVSNQADGTGDGMGYNRNEHIELGLVTNVKDTSYRILFYSDKENFQKILDTEGTIRTVYYPMYMYADIRQKLDQYIQQKRKVQLILIIRKEGYSEATLKF